MSDLFNQIANFYGGDSFLKATYSDICFVASDMARSLVSGGAVEVRYFDGFMNVRKQIPQVSRLDTIVCLGKLSALLETRLASMEASEIEVLDRQQKMLSGGSNDAQ
jgi:hypothetical protein